MQAATSSLHPAIVSKGAELFAYAETKRERFMQMRVQKDVKGTVCKRCREDGESSASRKFLPFNHLLTIERLPFPRTFDQEYSLTRMRGMSGRRH